MKDCYNDYAKNVVFSNFCEKKFLEWGQVCLQNYYLPHLPVEKNASILEIGCGCGRYLYLLKKLGFKNIEGIDISADQIQYAKNNFNLEENVQLGDALEVLKTKTKHYDAILILDVLEHLEFDYSICLIKEMHRALKDGGKIILQVPNALAPLAPIRYADITHLRAYTPSSINQSLRMGGFQQVCFSSLPAPIHGYKSLIRRVLWKLFINPLITFYMLVTCGDKMGGIYTPNILATATKN
ncbi:MAG: class I SAM-dependent methyltransferase [Parachlamydiales bacterium]|nr:class I SAM-dependent methyltransferase [Parachlamydiales bacterium]